MLVVLSQWYLSQSLLDFASGMVVVLFTSILLYFLKCYALMIFFFLNLEV